MHPLQPISRDTEDSRVWFEVLGYFTTPQFKRTLCINNPSHFSLLDSASLSISTPIPFCFPDPPFNSPSPFFLSSELYYLISSSQSSYPTYLVFPFRLFYFTFSPFSSPYSTVPSPLTAFPHVSLGDAVVDACGGLVKLARIVVSSAIIPTDGVIVLGARPWTPRPGTWARNGRDYLVERDEVTCFQGLQDILGYHEEII